MPSSTISALNVDLLDDEYEDTPDATDVANQEDWLREAKKTLEFFVNKMVKVNGKFLLINSTQVLVNEESLSILRNNTDFNMSMIVANNAIDRLLNDNQVIEGYQIKVSNYKDSVLLNCWIMHEMRKFNIPKQFKGGIILLYLWLCLGVAFIDDDFINSDESDAEYEEVDGDEVEEEIFDEEKADSNQEI